MESFFCPATGKKLPGKHGQQDLIAARADSLPNIQLVENESLSKLARLSLCVR
jgi:hypothetical protein